MYHYLNNIVVLSLFSLSFLNYFCTGSTILHFSVYIMPSTFEKRIAFKNEKDYIYCKQFHFRSVKMNFKVWQFLQYIHLEPIRTGVKKNSEKEDTL